MAAGHYVNGNAAAVIEANAEPTSQENAQSLNCNTTASYEGNQDNEEALALTMPSGETLVAYICNKITEKNHSTFQQTHNTLELTNITVAVSVLFSC